jgi:glycosyltransferase involved in cell wall biosynthesis
MRILLVAPHCPVPADMGIKTHLGFVLRCLAKAHAVDVIGYAASARELDEWRRLESQWGFRLLDVVPLRTGWGLHVERLRAVLAGEPIGVAHYRGPRASQAFAGALAMVPDWVVFDYYPTLRITRGIRSLLLPVDCYSLYYRRLARTAPAWFGRVKAAWLSRRFAHWEARVYPRLTAVAPVGQADAAELRRLAPAANIRVLPVAVASALAHQMSETPRVLVGGAFWMPAVAADAVEFLKRWRCPEAELIVWGRGASAALRQATAAAGGTYVDWVENYDQFLASGDVYVYPQRAAAGLQTKVQQAMNTGLAVVAVPEILAALEVDSDLPAVAASSAAGLAQAAQDLVRDPRRRAAIGAAARQHIAAHFSPELVQRTLTQILEETHA